MALIRKKMNAFLIFKLPSVYICGVRVKSISNSNCITSVKHRWINQNPFKSMFWAVQGMAAELSTGALVMKAIEESKKPISMLVLNNKANFSKKARGRIYFTCNNGEQVVEAINKAVTLGEPQTIWMTSTGTNKEGDIVSVFEFEWTLKFRQ